MSEEITAHEQALRDARMIGQMLKDKFNVQPAAIPTKCPITGDPIAPTISPPPTFSDISLQDLGRQSIMY